MAGQLPVSERARQLEALMAGQLPVCERADHPDDPHFHYGHGARYWSRDFPHWDVDASTQRYAKNQPPAVHPDMDYDRGWRS